MCSEAQALSDWSDGSELVERDDFLSSNERNWGLSCTDRMAKERYMRSVRKRVKRKAPTAPARARKSICAAIVASTIKHVRRISCVIGG